MHNSFVVNCIALKKSLLDVGYEQELIRDPKSKDSIVEHLVRTELTERMLASDLG